MYKIKLLPPFMVRLVTGRSCANLSKICLCASSVSACCNFSISTSGILNCNVYKKEKIYTDYSCHIT